MTKILPIINLIGSATAFVYLYLTMRSTTRDDAHPMLIKFEWAFLTAIGLTFLHQVRVLCNYVWPIVPTGFSHLITWISALIFARYLSKDFK